MPIKNNPIDNRQLSPSEKSFEVLNRYFGTWFIVFMSRIRGPLKEEMLRQALDLVQRRHPRLNSRIVGSLDNLHFESEGTQKIPLRVVSVESWQEVFLAELNEKIDSRQGLMRTVLAQSSSESDINYLITSVHHAIIDGLSCVQLHKDILTYCQQIASGDQITELPRLSALPPINALVPKSMKGFKGMIKSRLFLWKLKLKTLWYRPETLDLEKQVAFELRSCRMINKHLDKAFTQKLANACKSQNTSMQAALCAAMLFAAATRIAHLRKKTRVSVSSRSAINLRGQLDPVINHEELGILVSLLPSFHILRKKSSFWELAREVEQQLKSGLENGDLFTNVLRCEQIMKSRLITETWVVGITNLGKINIPTVYGPFELELMDGATSMTAFGGTFLAGVITFQGKMLINFMFTEPLISHETMELLANNAVSYMKKVYQGEDIYFLESKT